MLALVLPGTDFIKIQAGQLGDFRNRFEFPEVSDLTNQASRSNFTDSLDRKDT